MTELEERFKDELQELRDLSPEASDLNIALMLKGVVGIVLSPIISNEKQVALFIELFSNDLKAIGYEITKLVTPEEE